MSSSPEAVERVVTDATELLWARRAPGTAAVPFAAALTGTGAATIGDAVAISLASSPEARRLLSGMELRIRTLKTGVDTTSERCVYSVRGPVQWSETTTARANSLGNEDVFVCATASRSFDTVENRVLVASLEAIARAGKAVQGPLGERVPAETATLVAEVAADAQRWREHSRLAGLRGGRLTGRDAARLRGGHRMARMAPVLAVRDRALEPFVAGQLSALSDGPTRAYHRFVHSVVDVLEEQQAIPDTFQLLDGALLAGALNFRHPARAARPDNGLTYRGVALLPSAELIDRLPWRANLPDRGVPISSSGDVLRVLARLAVRDRERGGAPSGVAPAQDSGTQDSGSVSSSSV